MNTRPGGLRPPAQARSQKTLSALLDAGRRLLEERPFSQVTVQDIVTEAGSSSGSFYARFDDKNAFFAALLKETHDAIRTDFRKAIAKNSNEQQPIDVIATWYTENIAKYHRASRGMMRMVMVEAKSSPNLAESSFEFSKRAAAGVAPLVDAPGRTVEEIEARLFDAHLVLVAILDQSVVYGGLFKSDIEKLIEDSRLVNIFVAATGL